MKNKIVIIVNGPPTSGKDTFCEMFNEHLKQDGYSSEIISSVGAVKEAATLMGWDSSKTQENRKALSDLKILSEKLWNGPNRYMIDSILASTANVLFVHIREKKNIDKFIQLCEANELSKATLYIHREGEIVVNNEGDRDAYDTSYPYQTFVDNNGTLEDLSNHVVEYCKTMQTLPEAEVSVEALTESQSSFNELVDFVGSKKQIDAMLAEYLGAKCDGTTTIEHPHSGKDVVMEYWSQTGHLLNMPYAHIGIFNFDSDFNILMKLAVKSNYTGTVYMDDVRKTYEEITLHILKQ